MSQGIFLVLVEAVVLIQGTTFSCVRALSLFFCHYVLSFLEISSHTCSFAFSVACLCRCERDATQDCSEGSLQAPGGDYSGWRNALY